MKSNYSKDEVLELLRLAAKDMLKATISMGTPANVAMEYWIHNKLIDPPNELVLSSSGVYEVIEVDKPDPEYDEEQPGDHH